MKKTVAVIGAGPCGLTAIKACKEEDIDVVCFEKTDDIGGLWRYHDDDEHGRPSVMRSTVINSHKEMSAYTDFPPPDHFPSYMHHTQLLKYIEMYADHFELRPHIRYHHEVLSVAKAEDYDQTGKWIVVSRSLEINVVTEEVFDGVMICTGHHAFKNMPKLPGLESFEGQIFHSHSLKTPKAFQDLRVLVVGAGNSGADVAVEVSDVAKKVYLSTRKGVWVVSRRGPLGIPFDATFTSRIFYFFLYILGWNFASRLFELFIVNNEFNHDLYGLKPKHRFLSQHPTTNDYVPSKILAGRVLVRGNVKTFTKNGVIFDKEDSETPIDAVVFATGYRITFPFIKEPFADIKDNKVEFYKHMFPPQLKHPSLVFIGLLQPNGAINPIADTQCQWYAQLMNGKLKLPSEEKMLKVIRHATKIKDERFVESPRHTIQVDWLTFLDSIAVEIGAKPNMWKLMVTDPVLFLICLFGPCLPYQYRLQGPHPWKGAKEAILKYPLRICKPMSSGLTNPYYSHFESIKIYIIPLLLLSSAFINIFFIISFIFK